MRKIHSKEWDALRAWGRGKSLQVLTACGMFLAAGMIQSCDKDILTGQPEWLGNSIYERLQEGITVKDGSHKTFNTTLRLIDELGYTETLSKTGSRTVFATPDDVFDEWFKEKGITYEQLTTAQKKMMFNNSMINNAYLLELMSNVSGNPPQTGQCMRRETYASVYDTIQTYRMADMPVNPLDDESMDAWKTVREEGKDIKILTDGTNAPMIHFLPEFMNKNGITGEDLSKVTNGVSNSTEDSWINGKKVISDEQTCKNGYIYVVDGVVDGTKNVAGIINSDPRMTRWASFLKRWSYPEAVTGDELRKYQTTFNTTEPLYNLRYFNSYNYHGLKKAAEWDNSMDDQYLLKFDPGWNHYGGDKNDLHFDAAVMIVPTNEALEEWWMNGGGKSLRERYGSWEAIPYGTLVPLINVNMQESFLATLPTRFGSVINDVQRPLGITAEHVKECFMGCNGVVYLVDEVYSPGKYRSVIFPTLVGSANVTAIIDRAIGGSCAPSKSDPDKMEYDSFSDFSPYLMAMDSRFALIAPYNVTPSTANPDVKMFRYIDPCSYGLPQQNLFEFSFENNMVKGKSYKCTIDENGNVTVQNSSPRDLKPAVINNRLQDLIDNSIIIGDNAGGAVITSDRLYYSTKAGSIIKAHGSNGTMNFQGGYQLDYGQNISVASDYIYDMGSTGNGVTYMVCTDENSSNFIDLPQTATKSVYEVLKEEANKPESKCKLFFELLHDPSNDTNEPYLRNPLLTNTDGSYKCANNTENYNLSLFDNYNYTVYVPTDKAIQELIDRHVLPTWDDFEEAHNRGDDELCEKIVNRIHDFIRYHVQDRAVCLNGGEVNEEKFETAKLNPTTNRYYSLTVNAGASGYSVTDLLGNTCNVVTSGNFYNRICREYWISGTPGLQTALLQASSNAVVHQIDGVLLFDNSQNSDWRY